MPHVRGYLLALDRSARRDHSAFRDYDHAISNVIVFAIRILRFTLRRNHHPVPDARVLIDNGPLNAAMASDAQWWSARIRLPGFCLVKVCPHQDRVADRRAASDHAPNPDYRPVDVRIGNDAAVGDNHPLNLRSADLAWRQVTLLGVDSINVVK